MQLKARLRKSLRGRSGSSSAFLHSDPYESTHSRPSAAFTMLPGRLHRQDAQAVKSAEMFSKEVSSALPQDALGSACRLNSCVGHLSSLLYPECLPERLADVAMILEAATLHDGILSWCYWPRWRLTLRRKMSETETSSGIPPIIIKWLRRLYGPP